MQSRHRVDRMRFAADRQTIDAELEFRADLLEGRVGAFTTGQAVGKNADMMATFGLSRSKIEDVTKDSTDRRADRVQDTERLLRSIRHSQNQRSPTTTVSPGFIRVVGGTSATDVPSPMVRVRRIPSR